MSHKSDCLGDWILIGTNSLLFHDSLKTKVVTNKQGSLSDK